MDFDITKVTIDGTVDDLSEEQLRELVGKFRDAQESNVAEFEKAAEAWDEVDEGVIEEFEDARESLISDITDADEFDEVPLTEDSLKDADFSELQEWKSFVAGQSGADDSDEGKDGEFDDFGKKSPKPDDDAEQDFIDEELDAIPGLELE